VSLRGPLCAHGVLGILFEEVRGNNSIVEHDLEVEMQNISIYALSNMPRELQRCIVELEHLSIHDQFGIHIWLYFLEIKNTSYYHFMKCWNSSTSCEFWLSMLIEKSPNIVVGQEVGSVPKSI
jgi:hypothetical protein